MVRVIANVYPAEPLRRTSRRGGLALTLKAEWLKRARVVSPPVLDGKGAVGSSLRVGGGSGRLPQQAFRRVIAALLLALGVYMMLAGGH